MPKFNADTAFESIEITLEEKSYIIKKITQKMIEEVMKIANEAKNAIGVDLKNQADVEKLAESNDISSINFLYRQLAVYLGCPVDELNGADIRKIAGVLKFINQQVKLGDESKNA